MPGSFLLSQSLSWLSTAIPSDAGPRVRAASRRNWCSARSSVSASATPMTLPEAFDSEILQQAGKAEKPIQRCFIIAAPAHISDRIGRNCQNPDTKPDGGEENSDYWNQHCYRGARHHDHVTESAVTEHQLWAPKPKPDGALQFGFSG